MGRPSSGCDVHRGPGLEAQCVHVREDRTRVAEPLFRGLGWGGQGKRGLVMGRAWGLRVQGLKCCANWTSSLCQDTQRHQAMEAGMTSASPQPRDHGRERAGTQGPLQEEPVPTYPRLTCGPCSRCPGLGHLDERGGPEERQKWTHFRNWGSSLRQRLLVFLESKLDGLAAAATPPVFTARSLL